MGEEHPVVFVVDDDPKVRNSVENLLGSVGIDVRLIRIDAGIPEQSPP